MPYLMKHFPGMLATSRSDYKLQQLQGNKYSDRYKRLPIGEKGIGRFGVHKLGDAIELTSKKAGEKEVYLKIDWTVFQRSRYLSDVPISLYERTEPLLLGNGKKNTGTVINVTSLRKPWTRRLVRDIYRSVNSLISPFESVDNFTINIDLGSRSEWVADLPTWKEIVDYALYQFNIEFEGERITKFEYKFTPWASMNKLSTRTITQTDRSVSDLLDIRDQEGFPIDLSENEVGKVRLKGYIFDQDTRILNLGLQLDKKIFKDYLQYNGGVRVFRDNLRVFDYGEPENDWLGLNLRRVNQPTKRISKNNVVGAVYLERIGSEGLTEKTNREGFVENSAYNALNETVLYAISIIENLKQYDQERIRDVYGVTRKSEPVLHLLADLKAYTEEHVREAEVKKRISSYLGKIEEDYTSLQRTLLTAAGAGLSLSVVIHEIEKIISEVDKVLHKENASVRALELVKHLSSLIDGYSNIIRKSDYKNEDLAKIIDQALFNTEYRLSAHKIRIDKAYKSRQNYKVKTARNIIVSSLINLIDNSIYWLDRAGRKDKQIFIDTYEEEGFVNIILADNGTGFTIPTDEVTKPFITAKPAGIGLGLHIVNEVMNAQSGFVEFPEPGDAELPSEFRNGACIILKFPKNK